MRYGDTALGLEVTDRGVSPPDELVVSEHTVKRHVAHVLQKLGHRDRIQVVMAAYE